MSLSTAGSTIESAQRLRSAIAARLDRGYSHGLRRRQVRMIALGGAIGSGLFLGSAARLHSAGPSLALVYAFCGIFAFLIVRAMGELVMHRPTSGSFVSYSREFIGEGAAYFAGWMYFLNWGMSGIADSTAAALYLHYWGAFHAAPQWLLALIALALVLTVNLISVRLFGEMEFWFSMVKVAALTLFLVIGIVVLASRHHVDGHSTGPQLITQHGGIFPHGFTAAVVILQGIVFAYAAIEMVGVAAGETEEPRKIMPRAINSVIWRIAIFYVGSVVLLVLLLPSSIYHAGESPFVTFLSKLGLDGAGGVMNFVVLTAALSSLNSGLYSTGRTLRSMGLVGSAPKFTTYMSRRQVPMGGIMLTVAINLVGVIINYAWPSRAFEIVLNYSALGILGMWAMIVICQLRMRQQVKRGLLQQPEFGMPGSPYTGYATLVFLVGVVVAMGFSKESDDRWTVASIPIIIAALLIGWAVVRRRVRDFVAGVIAAEESPEPAD